MQGSRRQYYLRKAYKADPDEEFVIYIKDLKSQCNRGRATFMVEDLMVHTKNKYKAHLLDEENTWCKPTEEQEKIIAMSTEINSLKKECQGTTIKTNKSKPTGKKQAPNKASPKKLMDKKQKAVDKSAWKSKPSRESDSKEDTAFIKTFENKKSYWCLNHNNSAGMWTLHHPKDCESGVGTSRSSTNTNITTFDTMDSNSDQE